MQLHGWKKGILISLFAVLTVGCASEKNAASSAPSESVSNAPVSSAQETSSEEAVVEEKFVTVGDIIQTDEAEITINQISFSYDVLPKTKSSYYIHYAADAGKVYIDIDVSVKNLKKQSLFCDEVMTVMADYNDGFTYYGFPIVEDSSTGFTYADISVIDPLESRDMRYLVDCPEEVAQTDHPLYLIFKVSNQEYKCILRDETTNIVDVDAAVSSETEAVASEQTASDASAGQSAAAAAGGSAQASPVQQSQNTPTQPDYSDWVPYSTGSPETLAENIARGNVVYYGGQYLASPEYYAMLSESFDSMRNSNFYPTEEEAQAFHDQHAIPDDIYKYFDDEDENDIASYLD